jgi:SAM-dependent methyltransferase
MSDAEWGSEAWNEAHFPKDQLNSEGDTWGFRWRGMEKMRFRTYMKLFKNDLISASPMKILDIGCALCDFTKIAWAANPTNQFWCMDISDNAVAWVTKNHPQFNVAKSGIPDIPFDIEFDLVFCLEVLCYGDTETRQKTIRNIHNALTANGKLIFSGVLDGGKQHHTEQEIVELIGQDFNIRDIHYNYWSLYRKLIENPLNRILGPLSAILRVLELSDAEFQDWRRVKERGVKLKFLNTLRLPNPVSTWIVRATVNVFKLIIGSRHIPAIFAVLTKWLRGSQSADEIIVIAIKNA